MTDICKGRKNYKALCKALRLQETTGEPLSTHEEKLGQWWTSSGKSGLTRWLQESINDSSERQVFLRFLVLFSLLVLPGFIIPGCEVLFIPVCVVHHVWLFLSPWSFSRAPCFSVSYSGLVLMSWHTAAGLPSLGKWSKNVNVLFRDVWKINDRVTVLKLQFS